VADGGLDVVIPSRINGVTVTTIGEGAFSGKVLTSIAIPSSVTKIGDNAFSDNVLTSVEIPDSLTETGSCAFGSNNITSITIGEEVTTGKNLLESDNNYLRDAYTDVNGGAGTYIAESSYETWTKINIDNVQIDGDAEFGVTLTVTGIEPSYAPVTYQWMRNGAAIEGAANSTYVLRLDDVGWRISVEVAFLVIIYRYSALLYGLSYRFL
jgi:hypothetical protein